VTFFPQVGLYIMWGVKAGKSIYILGVDINARFFGLGMTKNHLFLRPVSQTQKI